MRKSRAFCESRLAAPIIHIHDMQMDFIRDFSIFSTVATRIKENCAMGKTHTKGSVETMCNQQFCDNAQTNLKISCRCQALVGTNQR